MPCSVEALFCRMILACSSKSGFIKMKSRSRARGVARSALGVLAAAAGVERWEESSCEGGYHQDPKGSAHGHLKDVG